MLHCVTISITRVDDGLPIIWGFLWTGMVTGRARCPALAEMKAAGQRLGLNV
jgi:hypothetical protein